MESAIFPGLILNTQYLDAKSGLTEFRTADRDPWPRLAQNRRRPRPGPEIPGPAAHRRRSAELKRGQFCNLIMVFG